MNFAPTSQVVVLSARQHWRSVLIILALWMMVIVTTLVTGYRSAQEKFSQEAIIELQVQSSRMHEQLDRFRPLGFFFKKDLQFKNLLERQLISKSSNISAIVQNQDQLSLDVNLKLKDLQNGFGAEAIYLMDPQGLVVASSNFDIEESFINKNFQFRPYFQQALNGENGEFFGVGVATGRRGYFFSYPIKVNKLVKGVMVIKVSLDLIDYFWPQRNLSYVLTDHSGVVFYSSLPQLDNRPLVALNQTAVDSINNQRRYGVFTNDALTDLASFNALKEKSTIKFSHSNNQRYLMEHKPLLDNGWQLFALRPQSPIFISLFTKLLMYSLLYFALTICWLYWRQHQQNKANILDIIETKVERRTKDLYNQVERLKGKT